MKNLLILIFGLFFLYPVNHTTAQFRPYDQPMGPGGGDGIYLDDDLVDIYGNPIGGGGSSEDFTFVLAYTAFALVQSLNNEFKSAQEAAIRKWVEKQEFALEREIERQLGRTFPNYSAAQRGFFEEWVGYSRNRTFANVIDPLRSRQDKLIDEKMPIEREILDLNVWRESKCSSIKGGICDEFKIRRVRNGYLLRNVVQEHQFNSYYEKAVNDFAKKHYEFGGIQKQLDGLNNYRLYHANNEFQGLVNQHISYVNRQSVQRRMLFMLSYLIANNLGVYNQGQRIFTNFSLPVHFRESTVINESKKRETDLSNEYALFASNIAQRGTSACKRKNIYGPRGVIIKTVCSALSAGQLAIRNKVLERSMFASGVEQGIANRLCGEYDWSTVGTSWTVNVRNIGISLYGRETPLDEYELIPARIPISCITMPKRTSNGSTISKTEATTKVNLAWRRALREVYKEIQDSDPRLMNLRKLVTEKFNEALKSRDRRASFSQSACKPVVKTSDAVYCF